MMYDAVQCKVFSVLMGKPDNILYELSFVYSRASLYIIYVVVYKLTAKQQYDG